MEKLFKEPEGIIYNGGAILYAITGYSLGFFGLFSVNIIINILSSCLLYTSPSPRDATLSGMACSG